MFIPAMELFVFMVTILSCSCFGKGLELTATPSPVTEGGNLTLTCSMTANLSSKVQFFRGHRHLDDVELVSGECKNARNQTCNQQCSCTSDSKFSLTIFSIPRSFHREGFSCVVKPTAFVQSNVLNISVSNVLNISVIYKPVITLDTSNAKINESASFSRNCTAEGNPTPKVTWYHEIRELKHNGNLYFSEIKRTNSGRYTCSAISRYPKFESSELFKLVVLYGPDVNLTFTNTTENATNVRLVCTARGVPDQYTYRWKHMFGSTVIRDIFDHVTNIESVSTLTIPKVTYEDMGTYVCEASNGYRGRDGQILQRRQDFLYVKGRPRAIRAQKTYTTNKGTSLDINITYVSFPKALNTSIIRKDSASPPEDELSVTVSTAPVMLPFYNKTVPVDGYIVQLHLSKFQTKHQGHYQLYVWNEFTYYYDFQITISDKPDRPRDLEIAQITGTSVVISWIPGEDNGNIQTFTLTCQKNNGEFLTNVNLNHTVSSFKVENLEESVEYDATVYASNAMGKSESITSTFSIRSAETDNSNAATIGGAAGSAAATILIVCIVVILIRRKKKSGPKHTESRSATNVECTAKYNDDDDGLKANILYESAGPYYPEQPGPSTGNQSGDVYAVVNKSKAKTEVAESYLYAEVQKPKKETPDSTMNAEVQAQEQKVEVVVHTPANEVTESSVYAEVKKKTRSSAAKNEETLTDHDRNGDGTAKQSEGQEEDM